MSCFSTEPDSKRSPAVFLKKKYRAADKRSKENWAEIVRQVTRLQSKELAFLFEFCYTVFDVQCPAFCFQSAAIWRAVFIAQLFPFLGEFRNFVLGFSFYLPNGCFCGEPARRRTSVWKPGGTLFRFIQR